MATGRHGTIRLAAPVPVFIHWCRHTPSTPTEGQMNVTCTYLPAFTSCRWAMSCLIRASWAVCIITGKLTRLFVGIIITEQYQIVLWTSLLWATGLMTNCHLFLLQYIAGHKHLIGRTCFLPSTKHCSDAPRFVIDHLKIRAVTSSSFSFRPVVDLLFSQISFWLTVSCYCFSERKIVADTCIVGVTEV